MIQRIDPPDWQHSNTVQIDSDAPTNIEAIREIEQWAAEHGFARTSEYWLRQAISVDNKRVFRGICFRILEDERRAIDEENQRVQDRMKQMPARSIAG